MSIIVPRGLEHNHEFYSMDITGMDISHKTFLEKSLNTVHEYAWMVNLDGTDNPNGEHQLTVNNTVDEIIEVVTDLVKMAVVRLQDLVMPGFLRIDPDAHGYVSGVSPREVFARRNKVAQIIQDMKAEAKERPSGDTSRAVKSGNLVTCRWIGQGLEEYWWSYCSKQISQNEAMMLLERTDADNAELETKDPSAP